MNILKKFGEGSFGMTFLVQSVHTKELFVVKVPKYGGQEQARQELQVLEHIKKNCRPYLICIRNLEIKRGDVEALYLEYIPNTYELFSYLDRNSQELNVYTRFAIMKRLLEGLTVLHGTNVVHRDIKPENILVDPNKLEIHYIDFGGSCLRKDLKCLEKMTGTLSYMSPEIMVGINQVEVREFMKGYKMLPFKEDYPDITWDICKAADVWALGMTCVDLCFAKYTGSEIFGSDSNIEKLTNEQVQKVLLSKIPESIRTQENSVLITACLFLLETNWTKRPTAKQALDMMNGKLTDTLLKVTNGDDLERVAKQYALATKVEKNTRVFPSPEVRKKTV